jgi:phospholipid-transporting ATPase
MKLSKLICYYFYKNMILVFVELSFNFYCGYSGSYFFIAFLISMYNAILTTFQCFVGLYSDRRTNNSLLVSDAVETHFYYEGITNMHFNMKVFWGWVFSAALHGICIF